MGPPCKTRSFSVTKQDPCSLPLCGGEIYPRRGSRKGRVTAGQKEGGGEPTAHVSSSPGSQSPCCDRGSAGSGISRAQFAQLESGRNRTHPLGLRGPAGWMLAQKMASAQEESQSPKRLHPLRFPSDSIFEVTQ